jgi:spore coat protein U-like protein
MSSRFGSNVPIGLAAIAGLLLAAGPAGAQSEQDQKLQVTATIGDACTVTSASLDFGSEYDGSAPVGASGEIEISCSTETELGIELDGGVNGSGGAGIRHMAGTGTPLQYALYSDAPGSDPWEVGEEVVETITGTEAVPVHGLIPQQTNGHGAGLHTDEVTITLNF